MMTLVASKRFSNRKGREDVVVDDNYDAIDDDSSPTDIDVPPP